jgi:hypothetical protein
MSMGYLNRSHVAFAGVVALVAAGGAACGSSPGSGGEVKVAASSATAGHEQNSAHALRARALAAARVWMPPPVPINQANLRDNPPGPGAFREDEEVACRFKLETSGGLTPKFFCDLPSGDTIKVKYGNGNAEVHAEVAATRLLSALGFATDRMYVVKRVRCAGCPTFPFRALQCYRTTGSKATCFPGGIDYDRVMTFDTAVIERRLEGRKIEDGSVEGWAWHELNKVDPSRGGSSRAEVDALRLMAVLLAHWDNKAENQRLICPPGADGPDGGCATPLAIVQDVGATFGPMKVDLNNWRSYRIWTDAKSCTVSMKSLPYNGATFVDWQISEAGRTLLLRLLEQLTDRQLRDLFEGSHITDYDQVNAAARGADAWVMAFREKVTQIKEAGPCPAAAAS